MLTQVLAIKTHIPLPRLNLVPRPRLIERLNEGPCENPGLGRKLTLISAPAGFGKTTLVSAWLAGCNRQAAWLSLDEGDSDPARFLTYLVVALQTVAPGLGEGVLRVLQTSQPQPPDIEAMLTALLNEISAIPDNVILVLDDYHVIDATSIDDAITFLIEHLPPRMRLVITTREDPRLPLARLRARDQLTELRASELRFTPSEAAGFLHAMGLDLSPEDVAALEDRTEGWIAGLQLAALSMQGRQNLPELIRAFAGDHRYIVDYLVEEVLQRQPEPIRSFLLQTSILDRLNGALCDAVTGQEEGNARLEALERGNLFVVRMDDNRHWYRYHRLFAEVLSVHLLAEQPDQAPTLHRRASEWYEHHGSAADAIRHALAARDFTRAAALVERSIPTMRSTRQEAAALGWLKALPDELVRARPLLSAAYAWASLVSGELKGVEAHLGDAERWLNTMADIGERPEAPAAAMAAMDEEELRRLPGWIALLRAAIAQALGDVANTMKYARRVLDLAPEDDYLLRGSAAGFLGLAYWTSGDLDAAHRSYADCMTSVEKAGYLSDAIGCAIALADIRIAQGRLREAMTTYEQGLQLATEQGAPVLRGAADMYVGMSELRREHNDLDAAMKNLLASKELGEHMGMPQNRYRWRVAMARLREAQGDLDGALDLFHQADRLYVGDFFPFVRPIAASQARVWIAQGRLGEAFDWARKQGLSVEDDLSYLREFEHMTLARALLARYQSDRADGAMLEALGLLKRLLKAAEAGGRTGSVIEILVLQALAQQWRGDMPAALLALQQALTMAEPEGYVRTFVGEGPAMAQLLREAASHRAPNYAGKLLAAFESEQPMSVGASPFPASPAAQPLPEPLSLRELAVLRLFKSELSGPEIADELVIALSTLRTHTKSIYSKLNVNSRRAAVNRAVELDLV